MKQEQWKSIELEGIEPCYHISNLGNVKRIVLNKPELLLKQRLIKEGYYVVNLRKVNPHKYKVKTRIVKVHRLIAIAFIPNPNNYPFVLHYDDVKTNNDIDNLRWGTPLDNYKDMVRNDTHKPISRFSSNEDRYHIIMSQVHEYFKLGYNDKKISKLTRVPIKQVEGQRKIINYSHITLVEK